MSQPLHIKGAKVWDGEGAIVRDVFVKRGKIVAEKPSHAITVDLEGYTLFPGMVNAHDHLELNHYPRTKFRDVYDNAHQWGEDVNTRLNDEPFRTLRRYPLKDRLFIGGLKNLLCGATTVAHHGPKYREMYARDFPVRVLKNYGWAHSLHFDSDEEVVRSYKKTPKNHPWFIHLAEGTDEVAAGEYQRLKALGCVGENTVIVHGVGMTDEDIADAAHHIWSWIVCPSTNEYLLGIELNTKIEIWNGLDRTITIGNDSRLTSQGDLLDETVIAGYSLPIDDPWVHCQQTFVSGKLNLPQGDFYIHPHDVNSRNNIPLILKDGIPQIGNSDLMAKFPHVQTVACTLDGVEKRIHIDLARQVHRCTLKEKGLLVDALPKNERRFFFF